LRSVFDIDGIHLFLFVGWLIDCNCGKLTGSF